MADLAAEYGTPLFVYDEDHLRARCREAVDAFGDGNVVYATKAFLCVAMARLAHEEGLLLDVATGGELHVALAAGVPAERLVFHGNNKSDDELRRRARCRRRSPRRRQLRRAGPARAPSPGRPAGAGHPAADHARRRGAHPRVRAHRPGGLEVRLRAPERRRGRGGRAGHGVLRRQPGRLPRPRRLPGLRRRQLRPRRRGDDRVRPTVRAPDADPRWRSRRRLRRGRVGAVHHRVGPRAAQGRGGSRLRGPPARRARSRPSWRRPR